MNMSFRLHPIFGGAFELFSLGGLILGATFIWDDLVPVFCLRKLRRGLKGFFNSCSAHEYVIPIIYLVGSSFEIFSLSPLRKLRIERIQRILQQPLRSSGKPVDDQSFLFPGIQAGFASSD